MKDGKFDECKFEEGPTISEQKMEKFRQISIGTRKRKTTSRR